jgi:hypothetical protein
MRDLYGSINEFKQVYNLELTSERKNGDLLADSNSILNRWKITSVSYWKYMELMTVDK